MEALSFSTTSASTAKPESVASLCRWDHETRHGGGTIRSESGVAQPGASPFVTDADECLRGVTSLLRLCFALEPSAADMYRMLGYNVSVPPHVRQALFSRSFDNDDLLRSLRKPALIVHGAEDAIVKPSIVEQHAASMPRRCA